MKYLVTSDLHLREDVPQCRAETVQDWFTLQKKQLYQIVSIAEEYNVEGIIVAGDIFHRPRVPPIIEQLFLSLVQNIPVYIMPGQHDLPGHSAKNVDNSSFGVLERMITMFDSVVESNRKLQSMSSLCDWEMFQSREIMKSAKMEPELLCVHRLITPNNSSLPIKEAMTTLELIEHFSAVNEEYKIFIAGDYHHGHIYVAPNRSSYAGKAVIVPGCLNRQAADMISYHPSVVVFDSDQPSDCFTISIDDPIEMITNQHIVERNERNERIESFISAMQEAKSVSLSFEDNVRTALAEHQPSKAVKEFVYQLMGWNND
jgi:DNA repair exonuclease SbcCD nuclease subunit